MSRRSGILAVAFFALLSLYQLSPVRAAGTITLTTPGVPVTENFNTLANSGTSSSVPPGWDFLETLANANGIYNSGTGSLNTGDTYSFGASGNTERAFGGLQSGNLIPTIGASFTNNTGVTITSLAISYTGEQWRLGALARVDRLDFQISTNATSLSTGAWTDVDSLDFTAPNTGPNTGPLDGNAAANRTAISFTITGLSIPNGATFWIRWADFNATSADDGLSVDDFSLTPNANGAPNLSINDLSLAEGNSGSTQFNFTVSLSAPAGPGGVTFDIATQDNTATVANNDYASRALTAQTIPSGASIYNFSVTVNGDTTPEPNETFFVNVTNVVGANVLDGQGAGTILNDDVTLTSINQIQGTGPISPLNGTTLSTRGIVTGIKSNGFFLQNPDASADADPLTSEAIFVFTSSAPPASVVIGNSVQVTGIVAEFRPSTDPQSPPLTEISTPSVLLLSSGNPLPTPVPLTSSFPLPGGLYDQLEPLESMRVSVSALTVVAPTTGFLSETNATATSNGIFFGVVAGVPRPFREPGIQQPDAPPSGAPANVPRFDINSELIRVDGDGQVGGTLIDVTAGATVSNLVGPLDFNSRYYTILPDPTSPPVASGNVSATPVPLPGANQFTVASFNMQRFYDTVNDAGGDTVLTTTAFNNRLNKASLAIRNVMRFPDVLAVEEMEHLAALQILANKIGTDAVAAGQPNPNYQPFLVEGNDVGGIDVGFLVKTPRVEVLSVTQFGKDTLFVNPDTSTSFLNDRPPLVLRATISGQAFTVIVNHLRSLNGVEDEAAGSNGWPTEGTRVRAKRKAQAEFLANLIQSRQTADPAERIVVLGDFNAFQFNDGFVDMVGTVRGTPTPADQVVASSPDLVNPDLTNLLDTISAPQRYSYVFSGSAQVLDQVLVNAPMLGMLGGYAIARANADFPETFRNDSSRPERLSDHDMPVAYFNLPSAPTDVTSQFTIARTGLIFSRATATFNQTITITNKTAGAITGPFHLKFSGLTAGVTLANATGTTGGAPYITIPAIASLAPGASASVPVRFSNPANATINYSLSVLAGSF